MREQRHKGTQRHNNYARTKGGVEGYKIGAIKLVRKKKTKIKLTFLRVLTNLHDFVIFAWDFMKTEPINGGVTRWVRKVRDALRRCLLHLHPGRGRALDPGGLLLHRWVQGDLKLQVTAGMTLGRAGIGDNFTAKLGPRIQIGPNLINRFESDRNCCNL